MYTLKIQGKEDFNSEDEQDIVYHIKQAIEEKIDFESMSITNAFDPSDIYEEDVKDFFEQYDLSNELSLDEIIGTTMFYNFETDTMELWDSNNSPDAYWYTDYHKNWDAIKNLLDANPDYKLATAIYGDNGYLYFSPGYHFVNREGYMIYKADKELTEDYLI